MCGRRGRGRAQCRAPSGPRPAHRPRGLRREEARAGSPRCGGPGPGGGGQAVLAPGSACTSGSGKARAAPWPVRKSPGKGISLPRPGAGPARGWRGSRDLRGQSGDAPGCPAAPAGLPSPLTPSPAPPDLPLSAPPRHPDTRSGPVAPPLEGVPDGRPRSRGSRGSGEAASPAALLSSLPSRQLLFSPFSLLTALHRL